MLLLSRLIDAIVYFTPFAAATILRRAMPRRHAAAAASAASPLLIATPPTCCYAALMLPRFDYLMPLLRRFAPPLIDTPLTVAFAALSPDMALPRRAARYTAPLMRCYAAARCCCYIICRAAPRYARCCYICLMSVIKRALRCCLRLRRA